MYLLSACSSILLFSSNKTSVKKRGAALSGSVQAVVDCRLRIDRNADRFGFMDVNVNQSMNDRLGDFILKDVLGSGGSGTVYSARWGHRTVALKVLHNIMLESESDKSRFFEEARLLYEINHPAVVKLLGFGELPDGRPYLAMERLEGECLADRLARGPMEMDLSLSLLDQLVSAVAALHDRGLVHRDIKPENIFLVGEGQYAVLLDFGIAKAESAPMSTLTRDGGVRGTPAYMAPERFFGQPANKSSDVYELALVFYAMATGRLPWMDSGDPESRLNPARPSDLGIVLPGDMEIELLRALSTRAEARPTTVVEFGKTIAEAAAGGGIAPRRRTADMPVAGGVDVSPTGPTIEMKPASDSKQGRNVDGRRITGPVQPGSSSGKTATGPQGEPPRRRMTREDALAPIVRKMKSGSHKWRTAVFGLAGLLVVAGLAVYVFVAYPTGEEQRATQPESGFMQQALDKAENAAMKFLDNEGLGHQRTQTREENGPGQRGVQGGSVPSSTILRMMDRDNGFVAWFSYAKLVETDFFKAVVKDLNVPKVQLLLSLVSSMCSIDPGGDLEWIAFGALGEKTIESFDVVIRGKWTREKLESCVEVFGRMSDADMSLKRRDRLTQIVFEKKPLWIGWPDEHTVILTSRKNADEKWFNDRIERKNNAWMNPRIRRFAEELSDEQTMWLAGFPSSWLFEKMFGDEKAPRPEGLTLELDLSGDMVLNMGFYFGSEKEAAAAETSMQKHVRELEKGLGMGSVFAKLDAGRQGRKVEMNLTIDKKVSGHLAAAIKNAVAQIEKKK